MNRDEFVQTTNSAHGPLVCILQVKWDDNPSVFTPLHPPPPFPSPSLHKGLGADTKYHIFFAGK